MGARATLRGARPRADCGQLDQCRRCERALAGIADAARTLCETVLPRRIRQGLDRCLSAGLFWFRLRAAIDCTPLRTERLYDPEADLGLLLRHSVSSWAVERRRRQRGDRRVESGRVCDSERTGTFL